MLFSIRSSASNAISSMLISHLADRSIGRWGRVD